MNSVISTTRKIVCVLSLQMKIAQIAIANENCLKFSSTEICLQISWSGKIRQSQGTEFFGTHSEELNVFSNKEITCYLSPFSLNEESKYHSILV